MSSGDENVEKPIVVRNSTDLQRLKLEKLMKNPEKPVIIPERPKERGVPVVPDFVRNVMGSSAGAGSGEFHVYRHLRRKEYARQRYMKEKGERERLDDEYKQKLEQNKRAAEERTAKRRAKRLKRKQKMKSGCKSTTEKKSSNDLNDSSSESISDEGGNRSTTDDCNKVTDRDEISSDESVDVKECKLDEKNIAESECDAKTPNVT